MISQAKERYTNKFSNKLGDPSFFFLFLEEGVYPDDWKKSKAVPIHKKESQNLIKNYRLISLLPVFSKVFERITFNLCSITFLEISYLLIVNQVFYWVILAFHNSFPLQTRYINLLIVTLQSM